MKQTLSEYLSDNDIDFADELKEDLEDSFKTGKNFLRLYNILNPFVDLSEYKKVFLELKELFNKTKIDVCFNSEQRIINFEIFVDTHEEVSKFIREVLNEIA